MRNSLCLKSAVLLLCLWSAALPGCAASAPSVIALEPPHLTCAADPVPPAAATPADMGEYVVDLWAAGESCREAVAGYHEWEQSLKYTLRRVPPPFFARRALVPALHLPPGEARGTLHGITSATRIRRSVRRRSRHHG